MGLGKQLVGTAISALVSPRTQQLETRARAALRLGRGPRAVEFFCRAGDPYAYLLAQLLPRLRDRYGVDIAVCPLPEPDTELEPHPEMRAALAVDDAGWLARYYDVEFPATAALPGAAAVARANAVLAAQPPDAVAAFIDVGCALWQDDDAALSACEQRWGSAPAQVEGALARSKALLKRRGHYGSAMLHSDGLWTWGIDRLIYMERHLGGDTGEHPPLVTMRPTAEWPSMELDTREPVVVDLFYSFRSPYSYLAVERALALEQRFPVKVAIRPVLPMVMRGLPVPFVKRFYIARDARREAKRYGIPFGRICDPLGPGIGRCLGAFQAAEAAGRAGDLTISIGRGVWSEALDAASDRDLKTMVERAGVSWADAQRAIESGEWKQVAEDNREAMFALGTWGVPTLRLGDYVAWGQDRIALIEAKLERAFAAR